MIHENVFSTKYKKIMEEHTMWLYLLQSFSPFATRMIIHRCNRNRLSLKNSINFPIRSNFQSKNQRKSIDSGKSVELKRKNGKKTHKICRKILYLENMSRCKY